MIPCAIVGLTQYLDLESNSMATALRLRLESGEIIEATVDADIAARVVTLTVQQHGAAPKHSASPRQSTTVPEPVQPAQDPPPVNDYDSPPVDAPEPGVRIFGGALESAQVEAPPQTSVSQPDASALPELDEPDPSQLVPVTVAQASAAAPVLKNLFTDRNGKLHAPARTVPAVQGGYPSVSRSGIDPDELTSQRNPDEDGVGSV